MTRARRSILAGALVLALLGLAACGKYGRPRRTSLAPAPPTSVLEISLR